MEDSWLQFQNLGNQFKQHISHIQQLSPARSTKLNLCSSGDDLRPVRLFETSSIQARTPLISRQLLQKQKEIAFLKKDLASLQPYKEKCSILQKQLSKIESSSKQGNESKLAELTAEIQRLQSKSEALSSELQSKQKIIYEFRQDFSVIESNFLNAQEQRKTFTKKVKELEKQIKDKTQRLGKSQESVQEKQQIILALQEDNEKLRYQLEKAMDSLQKCQVQLSFIPKLRHDLHQSEIFSESIVKELESERKIRSQIQTQNQSQEMILRNLKRLTEGMDPVDYIENLLTRLNQSNSELSTIRKQIVSMQEKQRRTDFDTFQICEAISGYLQGLGNFIQEDFFSQIAVPSIPKIKNELCEQFYSFYHKFVKKHKEVVRYLTELDQQKRSLADRVMKYEQTIHILNEKQQEINQQIIQQQSLYRQLETDRHGMEKALIQKTQLVKNFSVKQESIESLLSEYKEDFQMNSVQTVKKLIEKNTTLQHKYSLQLKVNKDLEEKIETDQEIKHNLGENGKKQQIQIDELQAQVEELNKILINYEVNLKQIIKTHNKLLSEYSQTQKKAKSYKKKQIDLQKQRKSYENSLQIVIRVLIPLIRTRFQLSDQKKILLRLNKNYQTALNKIKSAADFSVQENIQPFAKFRRCVICVLALNRLMKSKDIQKTFFTPQISLPFLKQHLPLSQIPNQPSAQSVIQYIIHQSPLNTQRSSLLKDLKFKLLIQSSGTQIQKDTKNIISHIQKSHTPLQLEKIKEETEEYKKEILFYQDKIQQQESEIDGFRYINEQLQKTALKLQKYVEELTAKCSELKDENSVKKNHISSLEDVISRLEGQGQPDTQSEIVTLSELLQKFMQGYRNLESKLEQNSRYVEELIKELSTKNQNIQRLERQLEVKFPLESISAFVPLN